MLWSVRTEMTWSDSFHKHIHFQSHCLIQYSLFSVIQMEPARTLNTTYAHIPIQLLIFLDPITIPSSRECWSYRLDWSSLHWLKIQAYRFFTLTELTSFLGSRKGTAESLLWGIGSILGRSGNMTWWNHIYLWSQRIRWKYRRTLSAGN